MKSVENQCPKCGEVSPQKLIYTNMSKLVKAVMSPLYAVRKLKHNKVRERGRYSAV